MTLANFGVVFKNESCYELFGEKISELGNSQIVFVFGKVWGYMVSCLFYG